MKWILRYLRGISSYSLCFSNVKLMLDGYTYVDIAGDIDSKKFTLGLDDFCRASYFMIVEVTKMCCFIHH